MANVAEIIVRARDEASAVLNRVAGEVGSLNGTISKLAAGAGAIGLVTAAAVTAATAVVGVGQRFADQVETLDRLSVATGVSTQRLQVLQQVFTNAGLAAGDANQALIFLSRSIGRNDPLLAKLGITTRDTGEALNQLSDWFTRSSSAADRQIVSLKLLGRSSSEAAIVLRGLRGAVADTGAQMERAGGIFSEDTKRKARELDQQLDDLKTTWTATMNSLVADVGPAAVAILKSLSSIVEALQKLNDSKPVRIVIEWVSDAADAKSRDEEFTRTRLEQLDKLKRGTKEYNDLVREMIEGVQPLPTFEGFGGSGRSRGGGGGSFAPTPVPPDDSERAKQIEKIGRILRVTEGDARRVLAALDAIADAKSRMELQDAAIRAGVLGRGQGEHPEFLPQEALRQAGALAGGGLGADAAAELELKRAAAIRLEIGEMIENIPGLSFDAFTQVTINWQDALDAMLDAASIFDDALHGTFSALTDSLGDVFQSAYDDLRGLAGQVQTVKTAVLKVIDSLVAEALRMLAKLAAASVFKFLISLLGGGLPTQALAAAGSSGTAGPELGLRGAREALPESSAPAMFEREPLAVPAVRTPEVDQDLARALAVVEQVARPLADLTSAVGAAVAGVQGFTDLLVGVPAFERRAPVPALPEPPPPPAGNTYYIQALNSRDIAMSLQHPGGELRRANDRVMIEAAD